MKWLLSSLILSLSNIVLMRLYAASMLGITPRSLPLALAFVSLCCTVASVFMALASRKKEYPLWPLNLIAAVIWAGMIAFNLWTVEEILNAV